MRILVRRPEELWLDTEADALEAVLRDLRMYKIGRQVEIADRTAERTILSLIGPRVGRGRSAARRRRRGTASDRARVGARRGRRASSSPPTPASTCCSTAARRRRAARRCSPRAPNRCRRGAAEVLRIERGRPALRRRHERRRTCPARRHRRARGELHEGLLRRPGAGRAHAPQGPAQPPPARAAAVGAGRARRAP